MLSNRIKSERSRVYDAAIQTGKAEFVKSSMEDFNKKVLNAIVD